MLHELKIKKEYFEEVKEEIKTFELRKDDRNYKTNDLLILDEIDEEGRYTGRRVERFISYILRDCEEYGLKPGYCILALSVLPV